MLSNKKRVIRDLLTEYACCRSEGVATDLAETVEDWVSKKVSAARLKQPHEAEDIDFGGAKGQKGGERMAVQRLKQQPQGTADQLNSDIGELFGENGQGTRVIPSKGVDRARIAGVEQGEGAAQEDEWEVTEAVHLMKQGSKSGSGCKGLAGTQNVDKMSAEQRVEGDLVLD